MDRSAGVLDAAELRAGKARGGRIPHHFTLLQIWFFPAGIKMVRDGRLARALKNSQLTCGETKGI